MEVAIDYMPSSAEGTLAPSPDLPAAAWRRIQELVVAVQPDAEILASGIRAEWATILSIAPGLATLRSKYGFTTPASPAAKAHLLRYRLEVQATRNASGTLRIDTTPESIPELLRAAKFTKRQLKDYQLRDASRMLAIPNAANFSVPGAGKTTVAFAVHVLTRTPDTHLLVVAPKNAFAAWDEVVEDCIDTHEINAWRFARLVGGAPAIRSILQAPPLRMIISYDQLIRVREHIVHLLSSKKVHVILDESHRMKAGDRSARGTTLLQIAHLPVRRDILSGTPIPRSIDDITPQMDFLWPGQGVGAKVAIAEHPNRVLQGLYVRTTKQELGLPPIKREFIPVRMSAPQTALYGIIRQEVVKKLTGIRANINVDLISAKKSVMRLLQASTNPILVVRRLTGEMPASYPHNDPKVEAIFAAIAEENDSPKMLKACELARQFAAQGQKTVIWSSFTENVERLAELLADVGATYIHGQVDAGDDTDLATREGRIRLFNDRDSNCKVLVANPAACSEGISLHKVCHHAVYLDRTYNAAHYLQSVDRIHRLGLPPETLTHIHVLESVTPSVTGSIDFSVRRRLVAKLRTMATALDDRDLQRLALDEEEADEPVDFDITLEDLADVVDELLSKAPTPQEEEDL